MWGAVIGDIVGAPYEFDNLRSKDFPLFYPGNRATFTDDTVCTLAIAESLLNGGDSASCLRRWGVRYPHCGFGGLFYEWLLDDAAGPYQSFGNGAAMRISPVALFAPDMKNAMALSDKVTGVTHNHPDAIL